MMGEFPLLVFTVLTGLSAGSYVMVTVYGLLGGEQKRSFMFDAICLVCLGVGLLGVLFHLGHPERFLNALANPTAMISQEAYWSIPFGALLFLDAVLVKVKGYAGKALPIVISIFGCGLMTVTSIAYFTSYGIAGWPEIPTLFQFIGGDLALGASFALAFLDIKRTRVNTTIAIALQAIYVVVLAAQAVVFAGLPVGPIAFVVAAVLAVAAIVVECRANAGKEAKLNAKWVVFCLVAVSVVIARYAFYSAA